MAAQTARQLITRTLRDLGVLGVGETPTGPEAVDALLKLNELLESWSLERLMVYAIAEVTKPLTGGVATYTIGAGGSINTARPLRIEHALLRDAAGLDVPVAVLSLAEYAAIPLKSTQSTGSTCVYYNHAYSAGLGQLTFFPVPSASDTTAHLWLWQPLTAIATLDTSIDLPPGYTRALRSNLALDLAAEYGRPLEGGLVGVALDAKTAIKSQAAEGALEEMGFDARLLGRRQGAWDYRTGGHW